MKNVGQVGGARCLKKRPLLLHHAITSPSWQQAAFLLRLGVQMGWNCQQGPAGAWGGHTTKDGDEGEAEGQGEGQNC